MASRVLKRDASPGLVAQVKRVEDQCDTWSDTLALASFTPDVAAWGVLTEIINLIEQYIGKYGHGSQEQREAMMNLGRAGSLLLEWARKANLPQKAQWRRWTPALAEASRQAVQAAHHYGTFVSCFTAWHKDRMAVEVLSPTHLRFNVPPSQIDRRIRAHRQGARIPNWPSTPDNPVDKSLVENSDVNKLLSRLWNKVTFEGALAMRYPDDSELLGLLRDVHETRVRSMFRRAPRLDLGGYDLDTFRRFFTVLLSLCAVHEHLCYAWFKSHGRYPFESAVMVRPLADWVDVIARLSGVEDSRVRGIVSDLTFGATRPLDIYIHPFVSSHDGQTLFLIPHFILSSRAEENILRVCSYVRPQFYSVISSAKETEMRDGIKEQVPSRYVVTGPLKLPEAGLPDIDVLIMDSGGSDLLVGELKWPRKTIRVLEHLDRDGELEEGFRQLRDVRAFLGGYPGYLQERGVTTVGVSDLALRYAVIARDHLAYLPQQDGLWLTEFDALIWALKNADGLADAIDRLQAYEWLPVEGRDFTVRFESATLAGVTIDAEVFHRPKDLKAAGISA